MSAGLSRIDVHSHFLPIFYREALASTGHGKPDGMPKIPEWDIDSHLSLMASMGISKSILSISSPGTGLYLSTPAKSVKLTRSCNEFAADLKRQYPGKFGFWAGLPLPLVNESLREAETALREGADGIGLMTNYQGHYVGDPIFDPVLAFLDARSAIIFIHPTSPCTCHNHNVTANNDDGANGNSTAQTQTCEPATPLFPPIPNPMFEFFFDTARVVSNLLLRRVPERYPHLRFIIPHAGGAFPPLLSRITRFSGLVPEAFPSESGISAVSEDEARTWMGERFWFDLAGVVFPGQLAGMMAAMGTSPGRLLYGSDFPFTQAGGVTALAGEMDEGLERLLGREKMADVYYKNAERLLLSAWAPGGDSVNGK